MHKDGRAPSVQNDVSAYLAHICVAEERHATVQESAQVRQDSAWVEEPSQWASLELKRCIQVTRWIAQCRKRQVHEPVEAPQSGGRLKTDHEDRDVEFIQKALLVTQLRDVLSARYSPEPAQEHEQHWFAAIGSQRDSVTLKIQQLNVENIVHHSPLVAARLLLRSVERVTHRPRSSQHDTLTWHSSVASLTECSTRAVVRRLKMERSRGAYDHVGISRSQAVQARGGQGQLPVGRRTLEGWHVEEFDVAVIGGGTAGITAAQIAQANGKRVVLIEQSRLGGECTWDGCVPSKALIQAARLRHDIGRAAEFGLRVEGVHVDFPAVMASVWEAVATIAGYEDVAHMEARGITVRSERARLCAGNILALESGELHADRVIVCTGSRPALPPIPGLDDVPYLTNESLFALERLPTHLMILGAGAIGLEMGQAFRRLGSQVTILDLERNLLPREDMDVVASARRVFEGEGIRFLLGSQVERVSSINDGLLLDVSTNGHRTAVMGDTLLVATGRRPNTEGLGLEEVGVVASNAGISVNEKLETTVDGIYAAGDVTGLFPFTHVAAYQARIAAQNATGKRSKADYRVVPWVIFTDPEIAHVGLTEVEARERHSDNVQVVELPYTAIDRAIIERKPQGLIKIIVGKKPVVGYALGGGEVLGAHLVGPGAGELLHEFVVSMQARTFSGRLAQAVHAYPTMSVGVQQAAGLLFPSGRTTVDLRGGILPALE